MPLNSLPNQFLPVDKTDSKDSIRLSSGSDRKWFARCLKTIIDFVGAGALLLFLSPLFVILGLLILLLDGAPIFYRRRVVSLDGGFDAYKFRTMIREADAVLAADSGLRAEYAKQFKLRSDPRVTRIGAWLRKYSLDELPQLVNVLKGQMSLVGPRMISKPELQYYGIYQPLLLTVKPGLTGYWQVEGRQEVSYEERVRMDIYYITHWSFILDIMILLKTPTRVILGRGAY
jgi:lipopolysaccharide/colanic/teichoic acid biosynthesis glycosyltransferase